MVKEIVTDILHRYYDLTYVDIIRGQKFDREIFMSHMSRSNLKLFNHFNFWKYALHIFFKLEKNIL